MAFFQTFTDIWWLGLEKSLQKIYFPKTWDLKNFSSYDSEYEKYIKSLCISLVLLSGITLLPSL